MSLKDLCIADDQKMHSSFYDVFPEYKLEKKKYKKYSRTRLKSIDQTYTRSFKKLEYEHDKESARFPNHWARSTSFNSPFYNTLDPKRPTPETQKGNLNNTQQVALSPTERSHHSESY